MVRNLGLRSAMNVASRPAGWSRLDPAQPHCEGPDHSGLVGCFETDRPGNLDFYRRVAFELDTTT